MKITLDLSDEQVKEIVVQYMGLDTRLNGSEGASKPSANPGSGLTSKELAERRTWLRANGYQVADQGRIKKSLLKIYDDQHSG